MAIKRLRKFCVSILLGILLVCTVHSQSKISIRLKGGLSIINGGDLNSEISEYHKLISDYNEVPGWSASLSLDEMNQLIIFGGDIVFHLKGNFGIGVGTEYLSNTVNGFGEFDYSELIDQWWGTEFWTQNEFREESYMLKAIPILVHLYYSIPVGSKGLVFLNLGAGYYFGRYEYSSNYNGDAGVKRDSWWYLDDRSDVACTGITETTAKATAVGFHGGLGIEFDFTSNLGLIFEARGRMVNFKNWDGDFLDDWNSEGSYWVESKGTTHESDSRRDLETGKMWLYTFSSDTTNGTYKTIGVWTEQPETSHREAEININGFAFTTGIIIRF